MGSPPRFGDLPDDLRVGAERIVAGAERSTLAKAEGFEFATWRLATRPLPGAADPAWGEGLRAVVRVELRERLETAWPARRFEPEEPDLIVEVRPDEEGAHAWLEPQPVHVAGRYRKLVRGLSQTVFHCRACRGRGTRRGVPCERCGGSGRAAPEAVEDFVRPPLEKALRGRRSTFHGSGREDVDVRMLGEGRPFVVTVEQPARRSLDAEAVAAAVAQRAEGRVTVAGLRVVGREERRRVTTEHGEKEYRVVAVPAGDGVLPADAAARLEALRGAVLDQRNPRRVARRADVVRRRRVRGFEVEEASAGRLVLRVTTDPGLYVKELVSGDEGRTAPSIAGLLGVPCVCAELDVLRCGVGFSQPVP